MMVGVAIVAVIMVVSKTLLDVATGMQAQFVCTEKAHKEAIVRLRIKA